MIEVSAGEVSTLVAGEIYCLMIEACQQIFDYGRAGAVDRAVEPAGAAPSPSW